MHIERESQPSCMRPQVQIANTCSKGLGACFFLDLKAKTSWLCVRHECAYELEDNFSELFQHVELL